MLNNSSIFYSKCLPTSLLCEVLQSFVNTLEKMCHFLLRFDTSLFARHADGHMKGTISNGHHDASHRHDPLVSFRLFGATRNQTSPQRIYIYEMGSRFDHVPTPNSDKSQVSHVSVRNQALIDPKVSCCDPNVTQRTSEGVW